MTVFVMSGSNLGSFNFKQEYVCGIVTMLCSHLLQLYDQVDSKLNRYFTTVEQVSNDTVSAAIATAQYAAAATAKTNAASASTSSHSRTSRTTKKASRSPSRASRLSSQESFE